MKYVLHLCLSLIIVFILSDSEKVFAYLDYEYAQDESGFYFEKAHLTKDNEVLVFETKYRIGHEEFQYFDDYRIKLNDKVLTFYDVTMEYITYEDEFYFLIFEAERNQLTLYNEKMQIVSSDRINFEKDFTNYLHFISHSFKVHENWVELRKADFNAHIEEFIYYDLNTKKVVNKPYLQATHAQIELDNRKPSVVVLSDIFNQTVETIKIKDNINFKGYLKNIYPKPKVYDNKILLVFSEKIGEQEHYYIYLWDLVTQSIITEDKVTVPYHSDNNLHRFDYNGKVKLSIQIFGTESYTTDIYEYDYSKRTLSKVDSRKHNVYYSAAKDSLNKELNSLYVETVSRSGTEYKDTIYHYNGQKMYELKEDEYWTIDGHFMKIQDGHMDGPTKVYDLYSRKLLFELEGAPSYDEREKGEEVSYVNDEYYLFLWDKKHVSYDNYEPSKGILLPFDVSNETYDAYKTWTVKLTQAIDSTSITDDDIYVLDAKGKKINIGIDINENYIYIKAPPQGYNSGETYTLYVKSLKSIKGVQLKKPKSKTFTIQS